MDYGLLVGVIGIVLTLVFGFIGIIIPYRRKSQQTVEFVEEENINLYNSVVKNISDLSLKFKDTPIDENVHLFRGFLINVGIQDITPEMIEKKLKILLSKNSKWLSAKIINKSSDFKVELNFNNNELEFHTGLFRHNEFIYFEAIAESSSVNLKDEIQIGHRIANTKSVSYKSLNDYLFFENTKLLFLPSLIVLIFSFFSNPNKIESIDLNVVPETKVESQPMIDSSFVDINEFSSGFRLIDSLRIGINEDIETIEKRAAIAENRLINLFAEYDLTGKVIEDYSYLKLLFENKTKFYQFGNKGKMQFELDSYRNLTVIMIAYVTCLLYVIFLINDFITYKKLKPTFAIIKNEIMERETETASNNQ